MFILATELIYLDNPIDIKSIQLYIQFIIDSRLSIRIDTFRFPYFQNPCFLLILRIIYDNKWNRNDI